MNGDLGSKDVVLQREDVADDNSTKVSYPFQEVEAYVNIKEFSDVVVKCCETNFDCHKVFLASRSPVFSAMFNANMKEKIENEVQIDDIKPDVLAEMLHFIYTWKCKSLDVDLAEDLLIAADKYQIDSLKKLCEERLICSINTENYFSLLVLGHTYSSRIKKSVYDYVVGNKNNIKFDESLMEYPSLMMELLREFAIEKGTRRVASRCPCGRYNCN